MVVLVVARVLVLVLVPVVVVVVAEAHALGDVLAVAMEAVLMDVLVALEAAQTHAKVAANGLLHNIVLRTGFAND